MLGFLFTYIMAFFGTAAGFVNPFVGLMVYYAFAILRPPYLWFWQFDPNTAPRFSFYLGLSVLAGWLFAGMGNWSGLKGARLPLAGFALFLFSGFVGWQLFAVSGPYAEGMWTIQAKIFIMALVTLTIVRDGYSIKIFIWVVLASLGYTALTLNEWYMINPNYLHNNGFGSVDNNGTGMIMVMIVPLCFFMAVADKRLWVRLLCFFGTACAVHVVLFSYSRGSQLGLCIVGAAIFFFAVTSLPYKAWTLIGTAVFVGITLYLAGDGVRERFMSIFAEDMDASAESRFTTWSAGLQCIKDNPLGVGPRNFAFHAHMYGLTGGKSIHNLYLQVGADYGIFGLLGMVIFYFGTLWRCWRMSFSPAAVKLVWPRFLALGVCTSLGGFLTCSMFIGMESVEVGYIIALLGLTTATYLNRINEVGVAPAVATMPELWEVRPPDTMGYDDRKELPQMVPPMGPAIPI